MEIIFAYDTKRRERRKIRYAKKNPPKECPYFRKDLNIREDELRKEMEIVEITPIAQENIRTYFED